MFPISIGLIVFICTFGGAVAGMRLRLALPDEHLEDRSKSTINASIGLVATMTALVLGLVTASAKSSYDSVDSGVKHTASQIVILDRTLARLGPETRDIRVRLKELVAARVDAIWPEDSPSAPGKPIVANDPAFPEHIANDIRTLAVTNDVQRALQARAVDLVEQILDTRWIVLTSTDTPVPTAFIVIMMFWLSVTFASFGLFAPRNRVVIAALFVSAMSVSCAILLVLELGSPFDGIVKVSGEPMRHALSLLNR
ncbi:MAG TPA: DUF4239 domain-containing protein [Burkholderiaceae bacterium]|nr:DUF4239 domain-containing protein [Burkholderiaceae bacterium]HQR75480.1 DUF4239 domain-containing protein [Burkholderiaceae bacterium]